MLFLFFWFFLGNVMDFDNTMSKEINEKTTFPSLDLGNTF